MEEEELGKTVLKADLLNVKPEHDCGQVAEGETQVSEGQCGEEQVRGLDKGWLCTDDSENGGVSHDGDGFRDSRRGWRSRCGRPPQIQGCL